MATHRGGETSRADHAPPTARRAIFSAVMLACAASVISAFAGVPAAIDAGEPEASIRAFRVPAAHVRLSNGLQVVVSEDHAAPVVAVNVMYRAGTRVESPGRSGLAHFFEHMMFQGTDSMNEAEYVRTINGVGGRFNGATRADYANYYTVVPSNALDVVLRVEADRMHRLRVTPERVENQRAVVLEEVRQSQGQSLTSLESGHELPRLAFSNWQNAHNGYGELSDLELASVEDMAAFYRQFYTPANAVLVVVGDCRSEEVIALARKHFGAIPNRQRPRVPDPSELPADPTMRRERSSTIRDAQARGATLAVGYRLPPRMTKPFLALSLLHTLVARDGRSLLQRQLTDVKHPASLVMGTFHALGNDFDFDGPMLYTIRVDYPAERAAREILDELDRLVSRLQQEVTSEELAEAKARYAMWFLDQVAGPGNPWATRAKMLAAFTLFDGSPEGLNRVLPGIMALTSEDLETAARTWLAPANRVWIERRPQ